jgi:hypothetical protein
LTGWLEGGDLVFLRRLYGQDEHADDEKCSVFCECDEGEQQEEVLLCDDHIIEKERNGVDLETNDGIGIRKQCMEDNDASGGVVSGCQSLVGSLDDEEECKDKDEEVCCCTPH